MLSDFKQFPAFSAVKSPNPFPAMMTDQGSPFIIVLPPFGSIYIGFLADFTNYNAGVSQECIQFRYVFEYDGQFAIDNFRDC